MAEAQEIRLIGVCLSTVQQEDRLYMIQALNRHACQNGFRLVLFNACTDPMMPQTPDVIGEAAVFRLIHYEKLSAIIVFPRFLNENPVIYDVVAEALEAGIPVITIDQQLPGCISFSFAYTDVFERLCSHVIEAHGARTLYMMAGIQDNVFSDDRLIGFRRALRKHDIPFSEDLVGYGGFWAGPTQTTMERWFEDEQRPIPDAIICANDAMAITVCNYLQRRGCLVPRDCIVTGFDGIEQAQYMIPHLTTCRPDYDQMGKELVAAIAARLAGKTVSAFNTVDFEIVHSQSCGCAPVNFDHINEALLALDQKVRYADQRQVSMCNLQSYIAQMQSLEELPQIISDHFVFQSIVLALNSDFLEHDAAQARIRSGRRFTDEADVLIQRCYWHTEPPCRVPVRELVPHWELFFAHTDPIVVTALHFLDDPLGYCVFQPDQSFDDYNKVDSFMNSINAALGTFHGQMRIRQMNEKLRAVNAELDRLYIHDHMTGLLNRRGFYREFNAQVAKRIGQKLSVIFISVDLDGLKTINDTFGHLEGDNAIIAVSDALQKNTVGDAICARFGGDEFAVAALIPLGTEAAFYEDYQQRFQADLDAYNAGSGKPYLVLASIGYYFEPLRDDFDLDVLIKHADDQMYADKRERKAAQLRAVQEPQK